MLLDLVDADHEACPTPTKLDRCWHPVTAGVRQPLTELDSKRGSALERRWLDIGISGASLGPDSAVIADIFPIVARSGYMSPSRSALGRPMNE